MIILAVFRSRAHSLDYAERLYKYGIQSTIVSAPREAKIGCGLCVRFEARYFVRANAVLKTGKYSSFKGFYKLEYVNGRMTATRYVAR